MLNSLCLIFSIASFSMLSFLVLAKILVEETVGVGLASGVTDVDGEESCQTKKKIGTGYSIQYITHNILRV